MISLNKPLFSSAQKNNGENKIKIGQELIENLPVFTMKNDLESLLASNPKDAPTSPRLNQEYVPIKTPGIPEKKSASPFLSQSPIAKVEKKESPRQIKKEFRWEKIILAGIICFLLLAAGTGGYYYWISKQSNQNETATEIIPPLQEETIAFSIEKPNYLSLDITSLSDIEIKEVLKKYTDKVSASKALTPVEFIVTDSKNNPISFALFTSKLGVSFSQDLISTLSPEEKFSLFIYNDKEKTRLGLAISSIDDYKLKKTISQEEPNIVKEMGPLFLDISYDPEINNFGSSSYNNTEIRFINLTPLNELTVDYAIFQNKLVIGTTKMTLRSIMDYIKNHSQTSNIPSASSTDTPTLTTNNN